MRTEDSIQQTIGTPLGDLHVRATGAGRVVIDVIEPETRLPAGMSVVSVVAVLIRISTVESIQNLRCEFAWGHSPAPGDPESGECLDAQSWDCNVYIRPQLTTSFLPKR